MSARLRSACRDLLRSEQGIALPVAMLVTVIGLSLAAVPIMASLSTQNSDQRDQGSDAALTAADSGASLAISRQTLMASKLTTAKPCVKGTGTTLEAVATEASGWCPRVPTTGTESVGRGTFSYRVKPTTNAIAVVATGGSVAAGATVNRRLLVNATATATAPVVFGNESVVGIESVSLDNGTHIKGNTGSNGTVTLSGGAGIEECETVRVGPTSELQTSNGASASCPTTKGTKTYPEVVVPTETSNSRMFTANGDTYFYSGGAIAGCGAQSWQTQWCPTTRVLEARNEATITLSGEAPYVFCKLVLEGNTHLKVKAGAHIQIIFDTPESCGQSSGTTQLLINNGASIEAEGAGTEIRAGLYFAGSTSRATSARFEGGAISSNFVFYGPHTTVELSNGAPFNGAMLAKTITMHGGTVVRPQASNFLPDEDLPVAQTGSGGSYSQGGYIECSATANETEPSSGC
jgi:hypothetical protein